jgi:hypothetical protein
MIVPRRSLTSRSSSLVRLRVVGEFAPSITIRQSRRSALSAWIMRRRPSNLANAPGGVVLTGTRGVCNAELGVRFPPPPLSPRANAQAGLKTTVVVAAMAPSLIVPLMVAVPAAVELVSVAVYLPLP